MRKALLILFVLFPTILFAEGSRHQATEYKDFEKYLALVYQDVYVSSWAPDSASLKCKIDEFAVPSEAYIGVTVSGTPWNSFSWVCLRKATEADSLYQYDWKAVVNANRLAGKPTPIAQPPLVLRVEGYVPRYSKNNRCGTSMLTTPNQFSIPITDSTAVSLHISRIIDGESFREYIMKDGKWGKNPEPDPSVPHDVKYRAIVTSGRTKCSGNSVSNQFTALFNSKPEYRLFLIASGEAVFVIWGDDVPTPGSEENGGVTVHEVVIMEHGGHLKAELHDVYQGEKAVRWTEYTIEKGLLRRKVYDNSTKFPQVYRIVYEGGWFPNNEGN